MRNPAYVAVDWGTSSFRLWLIDQNGDVLGTSRGEEGMLVAAKIGFADILAKHLDAVSAPDTIPVIICGMAGARGGWVEAGYIDTPASLNAISSGAKPIPDSSRDIRILPGLAQRDEKYPDVMRGEETQLLGAVSSFDGDGGIVCMPGTHSKWVTVSGRSVTAFSTYMTGELFDVITHHSILAAAIKDGEPLSQDNPVFAKAVRSMSAQPGRLTSQLFAARSGQILHGMSATDAIAHISGSLIGAEIAGALIDLKAGSKVVLVATGRLQSLYKAAFQVLNIDFVIIDADAAVLSGLATAARSIWPNLISAI